MSEDQNQPDAVVHKFDEIPTKMFGEGIKLRRVTLNTIAQTWIEMEKGEFSPLHRHEDEQTVVLIKGKLRARSGPRESEKYTEMNPGDIMTVPSMTIHQVEALEESVFCEAFGPGPNLKDGIQSVFMRKQERAEAAKKAAEQSESSD